MNAYPFEEEIRKMPWIVVAHLPAHCRDGLVGVEQKAEGGSKAAGNQMVNG